MIAQLQTVIRFLLGARDAHGKQEFGVGVDADRFAPRDQRSQSVRLPQGTAEACRRVEEGAIGVDAVVLAQDAGSTGNTTAA